MTINPGDRGHVAEHNGIDARLDALEALPPGTSDPAVAALVADPDSDTATALNNTIGVQLADSAVVGDAVDAAVANLAIATGATQDAEPPATTGITANSLVFADANGKTAFAVDRPGTNAARFRDAARFYPSGNSAADWAKVVAALASGDAAFSHIMLMPGDWGNQFPGLIIPSETLVEFVGPFKTTLKAGANCNLLTNVISATLSTNIAVVGHGHVVLDGNAINQVKQSSAGWKNVGANWVHLDGLLVENITIQNTAMFGGLTVGVTNFVWRDVTVSQDKSVVNQDGIDVGPACSFGHIINMRGTTEDDVHSIFAKYTTSQKTIHPLYVSDGALYSASGNDTHHIWISGSHVDAGKNFFRLQAAEGSKLYEIHGTDIKHTGTAACRALVIFGEMLAAYIVGPPPASDGTDLHDITFTNFEGQVLDLVYLDSYVNDVTIRGAHLPAWGVILGQRDSTDPPGTARRMVIDGVTSGQATSTSSNALVSLSGGMTLIDCALRNIRLAQIGRVVANQGSTVSGIEIEAAVGGISSNAFYEASPVESTASRLDIVSRTAVSDWGTAMTIRAGVDRLSLEGA